MNSSLTWRYTSVQDIPCTSSSTYNHVRAQFRNDGRVSLDSFADAPIRIVLVMELLIVVLGALSRWRGVRSGHDTFASAQMFMHKVAKIGTAGELSR